LISRGSLSPSEVPEKAGVLGTEGRAIAVVDVCAASVWSGRVHKLFLAAGACLAIGCSAPARLAGRWVFLTHTSDEHPVAVGQSDVPRAGGPLHLVPGSAAAGACLPAEEYEQMFGATCEHESEGDAPGAESYVRWYCGGDLVVRARMEPCEERRDRFRVVEIAVATHE
jgi:hypothetical protein